MKKEIIGGILLVCLALGLMTFGIRHTSERRERCMEKGGVYLARDQVCMVGKEIKL